MNTKLLSGIGTALALCACAGAPLSDPILDGARATVAQAEADPNANQYAALDLDSARKDLAFAEAAAANNKPSEIDQPAYLATQMARIAMARGAAKAADAKQMPEATATHTGVVMGTPAYMPPESWSAGCSISIIPVGRA